MLAHMHALGHVYTLKSNIQLADVILELSASSATLQVLLTQEQLPGSEQPAALLLLYQFPTPNRKVANIPQLTTGSVKD